MQEILPISGPGPLSGGALSGGRRDSGGDESAFGSAYALVSGTGGAPDGTTIGDPGLAGAISPGDAGVTALVGRGSNRDGIAFASFAGMTGPGFPAPPDTGAPPEVRADWQPGIGISEVRVARTPEPNLAPADAGRPPAPGPGALVGPGSAAAVLPDAAGILGSSVQASGAPAVPVAETASTDAHSRTSGTIQTDAAVMPVKASSAHAVSAPAAPGQDHARAAMPSRDAPEAPNPGVPRAAPRSTAASTAGVDREGEPMMPLRAIAPADLPARPVAVPHGGTSPASDIDRRPTSPPVGPGAAAVFEAPPRSVEAAFPHQSGTGGVPSDAEAGATPSPRAQPVVSVAPPSSDTAPLRGLSGPASGMMAVVAASAPGAAPPAGASGRGDRERLEAGPPETGTKPAQVRQSPSPEVLPTPVQPEAPGESRFNGPEAEPTPGAWTDRSPDGARSGGHREAGPTGAAAQVATAAPLPMTLLSAPAPDTSVSGSGAALSMDAAVTLDPLSPATRGTDPGQAATATQASGGSPSAPARAAPEQVVAAIRQSPDGVIDVQLSPEELGRVRITLTAAEGGLTVMLHAERTDTLDLLRRHIDTLASAYRDIGYAGLSFSFSGGDGAGRGSAQAPPTDAPAKAPESAAAVPPPARPATVAGSLDLRL